MSADFPTAHAFQRALQSVGGGTNAFVTKLDALGTGLVYSTFLGGSSADVGSGIAVNGAGDVFVTGSTASIDFPLASAFQTENLASASPMGTNAFVTSFTAAGSALAYSSYVGGSVGDSAESLAVGPSGAAYVAGYTVSPDFPAVSAEQPSLASQSGDNAFVFVVGKGTLIPGATALTRDAGTNGGFDASMTFPDAAYPNDRDAAPVQEVFSAGGGGCDCRASGSPARDSWGVCGLVLGAVFVVTRRRRVRASHLTRAGRTLDRGGAHDATHAPDRLRRG
jgi:hypothetical protein